MSEKNFNDFNQLSSFSLFGSCVMFVKEIFSFTGWHLVAVLCLLQGSLAKMATALDGWSEKLLFAWWSLGNGCSEGLERNTNTDGIPQAERLNLVSCVVFINWICRGGQTPLQRGVKSFTKHPLTENLKKTYSLGLISISFPFQLFVLGVCERTWPLSGVGVRLPKKMSVVSQGCYPWSLLKRILGCTRLTVPR